MKYKTLNIHPILYFIIAVILSAFILFCLISLSYLINPINAKQNILQSSFSLLQEQDISPRINKTFPGSKKDNFTTSLMLNISSYSDTSKPFYYAATNPRVEGEATAMYISKLLKPFDIKVSRIAQGISMGSELEYADEVTLSKALSDRKEI